MACSWNPLDWGDCIGGVVGQVGGSIIESILDGIASAFADVATAVATWLWRQIDYATQINITDPSMVTLYGITFGIGIVLALILFLVQIIAAVLRQEAGGLAQAAKGLLISTLGTVFAILTTGLLLNAVDALCDGILQVTVHKSMQQAGHDLVNLGVLGGAGGSVALSAIGLLLFSIVIIISSVVVWVAMMIRKMLIIIAAVFAPMAFAGSTFRGSAGWVRRWIEFTAALIVSKVILVIIFAIGLAVATGAGGTSNFQNGITSLAIGCLMLFLGGFAPWMAIKMVHFAGDEFQQLHGIAVGATSAGPVGAAAGQAKRAASGGALMAGAGVMAGAKKFFGGGSGPDGPRGGPGGGSQAGGQPKPPTGAGAASEPANAPAPDPTTRRAGAPQSSGAGGGTRPAAETGGARGGSTAPSSAASARATGGPPAATPPASAPAGGAPSGRPDDRDGPDATGGTPAPSATPHQAPPPPPATARRTPAPSRAGDTGGTAQRFTLEGPE